jgi:hypothetical protein
VGVAILVGPTALGANGALDAAGVVALTSRRSPGHRARCSPRIARAASPPARIDRSADGDGEPRPRDDVDRVR